jgi:putative transposase
VEARQAIKDKLEAYGWRRMQAALRQQGRVVNHKKIKRLMRQHDLHPPRRRRFVTTTRGDHDQPIFPDRARDLAVDGRDQLPRTPSPAALQSDWPKADGSPT